MKTVLLNRHQHMVLNKIVSEGMSGIQGRDLDKLMHLNLLTAHGTGSSCTYEPSYAGELYLKEHPALPAIKMTENQAEVISNLLGWESYECAPSLNDASTLFQAMIFDGVVVLDPVLSTRSKPHYVLSAEGRQAFEVTREGGLYLDRQALLVVAQTVTDAFGNPTENKDLGSVQLIAKAALARRMGSEEYARRIEHYLPKALQHEAFMAAIDEAQALPGTGIRITKTDPETGFPIEIEVHSTRSKDRYPRVILSCGQDKTGWMGKEWGRIGTEYQQTWRIYRSISYSMGRELTAENTIQDLQATSEIALEAVRVCQLLNENLKPPYVEKEQQ